MLVFESNALTKEIDQTNCTLATIPHELISGINAPGDQFLGLSRLYSVLAHFKEESEHMKTKLAINFMNIEQSSVDDQVVQTVRAVTNFASQNKSALTRQKGARPLRVQPKAPGHPAVLRLRHARNPDRAGRLRRRHGQAGALGAKGGLLHQKWG